MGRHRSFLANALFLVLGLTLAAFAFAQAYPTKPVTMLVPQAPGGTNDIVAHLVAAELATRLGQSFVVDNRPGAGGNIGTQAAARANPDGYTLLMTISSSQAINPSLYKKVPFDPIKDFEPIAPIASVPNVLVVNPSFPAKNVAELIALAKAKPGEYRYASAGNGTLNHLLGEMLNSMAGIKLEHVPYKGVAPALNDVLGNQVPIAFASLPSVLGHLKAGKLRALGISSAKRNPALPEVPTIAETVPGYSGDLWVALFAVPRHAPRDHRQARDHGQPGARRQGAARQARGPRRGSALGNACPARRAAQAGHRSLGGDRQVVRRDGRLIA